MAENKQNLTREEAIDVVIEKITLVMAQGDQCGGNLHNKTPAEWKDVFNEAAKKLGMHVIHLEAMKSDSFKDVNAHISDITRAFKATAGAPVIILADASGDRKMKNFDLSCKLSNYIESLTVKFPKAIYVMAIDQGICATSVNLFSMKPKVPHKGGRIDPV